MKKIIKILFLFILFFIFSTKEVFSEWKKYENNPVLTFSDEGWDKLDVASPFVLYDNSTFKMWYQGFDGNRWQIGFATSYNGLNWSKFNNPIISPDQVNNKLIGLAEPCVIKKNNKYLIWLNGFESYDEYSIYYGESYNGIDWFINPFPVLKYEKDWERSGPTNPMVVFDEKNNIYHMWYVAASGFGSWYIGHAISFDGISWTKDTSNPLNLPTLGFVGGVHVIKVNNEYLMFYHTGGPPTWQNLKIYLVKSNDLNSWYYENKYQILSIGKTDDFDSLGIMAPSALKINNKIYLWYTGQNGSHWQIGLATNVLEEEKNPIILLPGLMGSWNKEAILHNQSVGVFDWKLLPFVKEYDGIINTLKNLGYQENQDFFVFPYDWRKSVEDSSEDLKTFINAKIPQDKKVNLIGHSLGGLVARIFTQKNKEKVNKIISVGSPHEGAVQVYKPLEAGEIDRENNFFWLAQKIVLILNKSNLEPDRETIRKKFPVAFDLFPTFNFLKNKDGEEIPINTLSLKNNLLIQYNSNFSEIFPQFIAIYGEKDNKTPSGYIVDIPDLFNKILKNYQDGQPISSYFDYGDYTVLSKSANKDYDSEKLQLDHGEIITEKESIKKIFEKLEIFAENNQILPGKKTVISPSLIFFIKSPIETFLHLPDNSIITDFEGIIFVENAQYGDYLLEIKGKEKGRYTIIAGQINNENDLWEVKEGEVTADQPETQKEYYSFNFNQEKLNYIFPTTTITLSPTPTLLPTILITSSFSPTPFPSINSSSQQNNNSSQNNSNFSSDVSNINNQQSNLAQNTNLNKNQILGRKTSINNLTSADVLGVKNENNFVKRENNKLPKKTKNPSNKFFIISLLILGIVTLTYQIINKKISNLNRIKEFLKKLIKSKLSKIKLLKKIKHSIFNTIAKR